MVLEQNNYWQLEDKKKELLTKIIKGVIKNIADFKIDENSSTSRWDVGMDLTNMGVGPYHIKDILEDLGYEEDNYDTNGWEMDYWFHFQHPDSNYPPLCLSGTAIIHSMYLRGEEEDYKTYEERENELINDSEYQNLIEQTIGLLKKAEELLASDK